MASSTGLPPRTAAALAYAGWWLTGLLFRWIERDDAFVRWHARQAVVLFGGFTAAIVVLCGLAVLSLTVAPEAFAWLMGAAAVTWAAAAVCWVVAIWNAASGKWWQAPLLKARGARPGA